jgi:hypothetical protein
MIDGRHFIFSHMKINSFARRVTFLSLIIFSTSFVFSAQQLTLEEILKRHADAVGNEKARSETANRVAIGVSDFSLSLPASHSAGKVLFASDAKNAMLISSFDLLEYPYEKVGYFRGKMDVPFITPGTRSPMGSYLLLNDNLFSERLFGGVINSSWRLFDTALPLERLRLGGRKKTNGKECYVLRFTPKIAASADSSIEIFIDAKTFRHVRTEYKQTIPDKTAYPVLFIGNQTGENINTLTEDFDDFRTVQGLTLPFKYTVKLLLNSRAATKDFRWTFTFTEYRLGQNFGEDFFTFAPKPS